MIITCPHCGQKLRKAIHNGIGGCSNCNRVFDSSHYHRLLSASWLVRRHDLTTIDYLINLGYSQDDAELVIEQVSDQCLDHQQFVEFLNAKIFLDMAS